MPPSNARAAVAATTAAPLAPPPPISKDDPVQAVLGKLYMLIMEKDNVSAAKVWLDVALKKPAAEGEALTREELFALIARTLLAESA